MTMDGVSADQEKRAAALNSVLAAVFLTGIKLAVGILTGSLGILAEAAHSSLDLVAALITFLAVRLSGRPPDEQHQYGHGKVENLSALAETLLLLATCAWIIYEAGQRLFFKSVHVEASMWAFLVMGISIVVDISRSRMLAAAARKHRSQALEADALHFSTDVWSSSVVIVGLAAVWLSGRLGANWGWLANADAMAALAVAVIVVYVSLQLGRRTVEALLDAAPPGLAERVTATALGVPGVVGVGPIRVRQAGGTEFADLVVNVDRSATLEEAHRIATTVEGHLIRTIPAGDVVIHVEPAQVPGENLTQTTRALAARHGVTAHNIHAHEVRGVLYVDLDVEVSPDLSVEQAHRLVSEFEADVRRELPAVRGVNSHIEPAAIPSHRAQHLGPHDQARVQTLVDEILRDLPGLEHCLEVNVRRSAGEFGLVVRCTADPDMPVSAAHEQADQLERLLHARMPDIGPVLVHVEPAAPPARPL